MSENGVRKKQKRGGLTAKQSIDVEACFSGLSRSLFDYSPDAIFLGRLDGKMVDCNEAACKISGYTKDELLKMKVSELVPKEGFRKDFLRVVKDLLSTGVATLETQGLRKDRTIFPIEAHLRLFKQEGKPIVFIVVRDISHFKEIQEQISMGKKTVEHYLSIVGVLIVAIDKQGKITLINKKGNDILGYKNGELLGRNWFTTCLPVEDREEVKKVFGKCMKGKLELVEHYNNYVVTRGGEKRFISWHNSVLEDKDGKIIGSLSSGEDITELRKISDELSRDKQLYTSLVENSNDGVVILQDGFVKFFNNQMFNMVGYTIVEAYNSPFLNFISGKYKQMAYENYKSRIKGKEANSRYELELLKKDGKPFPAEVNASLINFEGKPAVMAIIRDMTKYKEVDKIKSEFLSVVSHQLRTPLTGIKWFSELLLENKAGVLSEKQRDFVGQISSSTLRMRNLIEDLLDVSHIEAGKKYSIILKKEDISAIVREVVKRQLILAQNKKIKIKISKDCFKKIIIRADKSKISQVFENLIDNAIKYTKPGGKIAVSCKGGSGGIVYSVKDNGVGIPAHQIHRLFDKFFRGDNVRNTEPGSGLGLYIAKYIIEEHRGRIWCKTKENKGSTFYIFLPTV